MVLVLMIPSTAKIVEKKYNNWLLYSLFKNSLIIIRVTVHFRLVVIGP